ncbi:histidine kinase-, DNA gyrase B-, and HSP90-like ATPase family protein [Bacillus anthracis]|uniref:GHKL domain-containing protein n=1 Tax=Bacillus anthracis TaxID=1392 RepID=UPI00047847F7|nr:GHKL domain-containing protein [Bacillus anthracis]AJG71612.1 histidine kinase-, DNA gyrase B-, and HSP90-like ATPase family protein [Bacillus anthracis]AJG89340.1 histidine kinase-, DNA gyrase B-, and HSP90-like ATPase family protein [Bacillus anthracis]AJH40440.1 histidine kinase-, DNA gyrase B-, and HSP90-like ATPase family protein [Bacillus anthracis]AJI38536.1 histidine kinase-, DNA gyrase B-, and HSP90-like ATPase family protein [Bacillus anthracis]KGZ51247.1 histidine kinase [Bacillu
MYIYDLFAILLTSMCHTFLYIQLIRYNRLSVRMLIALSTVFIILLAIVVTVTRYPELNSTIVLFLISLGLMQNELKFKHNLYFALVSMVIITLVKMLLLDLGMKIFMLTPFNLYLWTGSIIHLIVSTLTFIGILLARKRIQKIAQYIVGSPLYYITYILLIIGFIIELILTQPSTEFLAKINQQYSEVSYNSAIIIFLLLLIIVLISSHLSKEKLREEHEKRLDKELLDYVEKLEDKHDELASFRHDYMNVLLSLEEGIRTKNVKEIEQVYYDVIAPTLKTINDHELDIAKLSRIQIPEVRSVLRAKVGTAQQQIKVMLDIPENIESVSMTIISFIRIISVLVDNAIEEAVCSEEKILQIAFFEMDSRQYFIVRNSSKGEAIDLQKIYEKNHSNKEGARGYGLFSLKRIINKTNNATLETTYVSPYFTQTFILNEMK